MRRKLIRKYKAFNQDFQRSKELFLKWFIPEIKKRFFGVKKINYKDIPIIINNYNRLEMLTKLIHSLESKGYHNLYIIDNQSTYPPLLEYYTRLPYPVYMLNKNVGHLSLWETGIFKQFKDSYYAYTDSDLEILPNCPDDFIEKFILLLQKYPKALKAGFSICIDDLPDHYKLKEKVNVYPTLIHDFCKYLKTYFSLEKDVRYKNKKIYGKLETREIYAQAIIDYISGMTDRYAIEIFNELLRY